MYHPGWAITISLEPTFEVRDRCGLSTSTRKMIQKIWPVKLPKMDPEMLARLVFCFENNPERHDGIISGAQDSIGICIPGLVRHNDDGFVDRESFKITDDAKKLLFSELNLSSMRGVRPKGGMLSFEDIKPKQLFYNSKERKQVDELATLLEEEHYQSIRNRLRETNFRSGFACLFYGAPGTGKTETVLQIARKTGRDLIQVNVSEVKSMWVGESEKNIKGIFDDYKQ